MKKMIKKQMIALLLGVSISTALYAQESVRVEAESLTEKSEKVTVSKRKSGETAIGGFDKGQWIKLENVDFGAGKSSIKVRAASGAHSKKASIQIRLGSKEGELIGEIKVPVEGWNAFKEVDAALSKETSKISDIYIVSQSGGVILDWVEFIK